MRDAMRCDVMKNEMKNEKCVMRDRRINVNIYTTGIVYFIYKENDNFENVINSKFFKLFQQYIYRISNGRHIEITNN